jgi:Sigma-70, region 4
MPLAWITTVVYRRAINFAYRRARQDPEWPAVPEVPEERLGHGHAAAPLLWLEATELLRALAELPERQRQVVALAAAGYTHHDAGERVGLTARGVENAAIAVSTGTRPSADGILRAIRRVGLPCDAASTAEGRSRTGPATDHGGSDRRRPLYGATSETRTRAVAGTWDALRVVAAWMRLGPGSVVGLLAAGSIERLGLTCNAKSLSV